MRQFLRSTRPFLLVGPFDLECLVLSKLARLGVMCDILAISVLAVDEHHPLMMLAPIPLLDLTVRTAGFLENLVFVSLFGLRQDPFVHFQLGSALGLLWGVFLPLLLLLFGRSEGADCLEFCGYGWLHDDDRLCQIGNQSRTETP